LISPWLDLSASRPSCRANDAYDYGQTSFLLEHARVVARDLPLDDPRVSPLFANLSGLAPLFVQVGSAERLFDESRELVHRARQVGVLAELDIAAGMPHDPPLLADYHPEAERALQRLATALSRTAPGVSA